MCYILLNRSFWIFLEKISYLLWCILRLCLGWELPQTVLLELRVLCPIIICGNSCWNKSMSKSWLDNHHCWRLQVLLVLFLISPLNDHLVVWAGMVLKVKKICLDCENINKKFIQTFKLLVVCLISPLNGLIVVWAAMVLKLKKSLSLWITWDFTDLSSLS